jgi:hypothetical protein
MVIVLPSSVVVYWCLPSLAIELIFAASLLNKHVALRSKSKDWLALNQENVSEWSEWSAC